MDIKIFGIEWKDDDLGYPTEISCDFIDSDNTMDDITETISDWLSTRYGEHDGFAWEFVGEN